MVTGQVKIRGDGSLYDVQVAIDGVNLNRQPQVVYLGGLNIGKIMDAEIHLRAAADWLAEQRLKMESEGGGVGDAD